MAIIGFIAWKGYNLYGAYSKSVNHGQSTTANTVQAASEAAGGVTDGNVPLYFGKTNVSLLSARMEIANANAPNR